LQPQKWAVCWYTHLCNPSSFIPSKNNTVKINQKLSYPIKHQKTGHIVVVRAESEEAVDLSGVLDEKLKTNENVIRKMVFAHPRSAEKERKPVSVIDQLRHQQREDRVGTRKESVSEPQPTKEDTLQREEADTAEIDKKIEELLN